MKTFACMLAPVLTAVLLVTGAAAPAEAQQTITLGRYEPASSGYVVSNARFEVRVAPGSAPLPDATEAEARAYVRYVGGTIEGYKYNGTIYRTPADLGLATHDADGRRTPASHLNLTSSSFNFIKVDGNVTRRGSSVGSFTGRLATRDGGMVWKGMVDAKSDPDDYAVTGLRITSTAAPALEKQIQSALSAKPASSSGVASASRGERTSEGSRSSSATAPSATGPDQSTPSAGTRPKSSRGSARDRQAEFNRESQRLQREGLERARRGSQEAARMIDHIASQRRASRARSEQLRREMDERHASAMRRSEEDRRMHHADQARFLKAFAAHVRASPQVGSLSDMVSRSATGDTVRFTVVQFDEDEAPYGTNVNIAEAMAYRVLRESIEVAPAVEARLIEACIEDAGTDDEGLLKECHVFAARSPADLDRFIRGIPTEGYGSWLDPLDAANPTPEDVVELIDRRSLEYFDRKYSEAYRSARAGAKTQRLRSLAEQGDADAQTSLADKYFKGDGMRQDYGQALHWYRRAAEQGHAKAQHSLGAMYKGPEVPRDYAEALRWYRRAADQGHADAMAAIGFMYEKGQGVSADQAEALRWFRLGAAKNSASANNNLGLMYLAGRGVEKDIAEGLRRLHLAAEGDNYVAQFNLAYMYGRGLHVPKDIGEAYRWARRAAEGGYAEAQANLGLLYQAGKGVGQDYAQAVVWYRRAVEQGHVNAHRLLAILYHDGRGVQKDYAEAFRLFRFAADQGDADARVRLAFMYYNGHAVSRDRAEAKRLMQLAAEQGHTGAPVFLAELF